MSVKTYISLTENYMKDYHNLAYNIYPSFQNIMYVDFYSLSIEQSHYDKNMMTFYKDVNDEKYGGRFTKILNFPILTSTNTPYDNDAAERGIITQPSSELNFIIEPSLSFSVKPDDVIRFKLLDDQFGFYKVANVDDSATLGKPYGKVTAKLISGITEEKLTKLVTKIKVFIQEYHKIYDRELAILILTFENYLERCIEKINDRYKTNLDFHVFDDNETIVTSYERAMLELCDRYKNHIIIPKIKLSYSFSSKFYNTEPITAYDLLINPRAISYLKRLKELKNFNDLREVLQMSKHKYYSADGSFMGFRYHDYITPDDYTCSASLIAPDMTTSDFWVMFDAWLSAIENNDITLFPNDPAKYNQTLYSLMLGWLKILVTGEMFKNQFDRTTKYFDKWVNSDLNLLEVTILLSQIFYMDHNFRTEADKIPQPEGQIK